MPPYVWIEATDELHLSAVARGSCPCQSSRLAASGGIRRAAFAWEFPRGSKADGGIVKPCST